MRGGGEGASPGPFLRKLCNGSVNVDIKEIPKHCTMIIYVICTSHVYTGSTHNVVSTFKHVVFVFIKFCDNSRTNACG